MKIQKSLYLALGLLSVCFTACNSNGGQKSMVDYSSGSVASAAATSGSNASNINKRAGDLVSHPATKLGNLMNQTVASRGNFSTTGSGLNPAHGMPGHNCDLDVGAPLPGAAVPAASQAVASSQNLTANSKINPAHGQPGHDCAVAVGAPLPSTPASLATQAVSGQTALTSIAAPNQAAGSSPNFKLPSKGGKVNPAHGQPGHDCSIAVGAPLNGAKTGQKPINVNTQTVSTGQTTAPAGIAAPTPGAAATSPNFSLPTGNVKVNPAHGKPGHDCAVAVGAPLPG
jgi:hypothetical protein